jgi:hypothetical protein
MHKKKDKELLSSVQLQSKRVKNKREVAMFKTWRHQYFFPGKQLYQTLYQQFLYSDPFHNKHIARQPFRTELFEP